jgi:hypothetical protein
MPSLLSGVTRSQIDVDPFPHVVVQQPVPAEVADALLAQIPRHEIITGGTEPGSNDYFTYRAATLLRDPEVSPLWREFVEYHASGDFAAEAFELFADHLAPEVRRRVAGPTPPTYGTRGIDDFTTKKVLVDAQIALNSPVVGVPSSVKGTHVDRARALYGATFYLRRDDDPSEGGALELMRMRGDNHGKFDGLFVDEADVELARTVPYEHNTLVLWMNSIDALHRVTPRTVTPCYRYYVNLLAEVRRPWYDSAPYQRNPQEAARKPAKHSSFARRLLSKAKSSPPTR